MRRTADAPALDRLESDNRRCTYAPANCMRSTQTNPYDFSKRNATVIDTKKNRVANSCCGGSNRCTGA